MSETLTPKEQELFFKLLTERYPIEGNKDAIMRQLAGSDRGRTMQQFIDRMIHEGCLKWIGESQNGFAGKSSDLYERDKKAMAKFYQKTQLASIDRFCKQASGIFDEKEAAIFVGILKMRFRSSMTFKEILREIDMPEDRAAELFLEYLAEEGCLREDPDRTGAYSRSKKEMQRVLQKSPMSQIFAEFYMLVTKPGHEEFGFG